MVRPQNEFGRGGARLCVGPERKRFVWQWLHMIQEIRETGVRCDCLLIPRIEQPLRYAVQYADESTRLHYNTTA